MLRRRCCALARDADADAAVELGTAQTVAADAAVDTAAADDTAVDKKKQLEQVGPKQQQKQQMRVESILE